MLVKVVALLLYSILTEYVIAGDELLIPSNEWQEVLPHHVLKSGNLHVRMDMTNGRKFAKIDNDKPIGSTADVELVGKNAVEYVKNDNKLDVSVTKKYRSLSEIQKELGDIFVKLDSEQKIIQKMVKKLNTENIELNDLLSVINELSELLHGIDNANRFTDLHGQEAILRHLNTTHLKYLCVPIMRALSATLENNNFAQRHFMNIDGLNNVLMVLEFTKHDPSLWDHCIVKSTSLISASQRACYDCFKSFVRRSDAIFPLSMSVDNIKARRKIISMLLSMVNESHHPEFYHLKDDFLVLAQNWALCDANRFLLTPSTINNTDYIYNSQLKTVMQALCINSEF